MYRRLVLIGLLIIVSAAHAGSTADTPKSVQPISAKKSEAVNVAWRFDGSGRFPNIDPPSQWQRDRNVLWKTPVEIGGYSSPIVVRDRVFVTEEMGSLVCLDVRDGKVLWSKDLFSKDSKDIPAELSGKLMRGCGGDSKQSTPTPTSNGTLVFYINAMGLCACYDLDGNQRWIRIIDTYQDEEHFSSSPIFLGDRIILSWGCLLALSAKDGTTLWKAEDAKPTHGTPVIAKIGSHEVAVTPAGDVVRLDTGEVLCSGLFKSTYTTPLVEGGVLYVVDTRARALQLPARAEKGMRPKVLWSTTLGGTFMASPVYHDGLLYTIENQQCRLHVIDAKTGKVQSVPGIKDEATAGRKITGVKIEGLAPAKYAYASPAADRKHIFFFDDAGNTAVLQLGRNYKLVRVNKLEDGIVGTPFFVGDRIVIRGSRVVYCIGQKH
jgi:outer membrane protein assembly factor BamB